MANTPFTGKQILLGVTGSIAAYKAADLASKLTQAGAQVDVILTQAALQFITPLTFQSVTGRRAYLDADLWGREGHVQHIGLAKAADLLVIAPASANTLARLAQGLADNLLCVTALAASCPLVLAPAMDGGMFAHPATQANLDLLRQRGAAIVGPAAGHLASGLSGVGRMVEPLEILGELRRILARGGRLAGRKLVVTAGGTQEPIDPVRVLANRSSGKQGFALAQAALDLGAEVTLVSGPTSLAAPTGAQLVEVSTAQEMLEAVLAALPGADALVMAAAVADFRPAAPAADKIKKEGGPPAIVLENTPDVLRQVAQYRAERGCPRLVVGFAAESQHLLENAAAKLQAKKLDLIVANDIRSADAGFGVDTNRVTLLYPDGHAEALPLMSKEAVAAEILQRVAGLLQPAAEPNQETGPNMSTQSPHNTPLIVHICPRSDWEQAQQAGQYRAASLDTEGFIHASRPEQVLGPANRFYHGRNDLLLLWIDPGRLRAPLKYDPVDGDVFPHLYGPLNLDAVIRITPFLPAEDGSFMQIL